jgi:RND superfamily putative drug exporter
MATLLHRLGRWAAAHARRVIVGWVVLLLALGGAAAAFASPLSNTVTIPGSDFSRVLDELGSKVPDASGGFATVVVTADAPIDASQRDRLATTFDRWARLPQVRRVIDPFQQQQRLDVADRDLATARTRIADGRSRLDAAWREISEAQGRLAQGREWIRILESEDPANARLPDIRAQVAAGGPRLTKAKSDWQAGSTELAGAEARYADGLEQRRLIGATRMVTEDGRSALVQVQFDRDVNSVEPSTKEAIQEIGAALGGTGLHLAFSKDITQENSLLGPGEAIGVGIAAVVLLVTLGSLVAAGLPILGALLGVGIGLAGALATTRFLDLHAMTPSLALMLGLAVGIDYALFIVNRHRVQLRAGMPVADSVTLAVATAGSAVLVAGLTVVVALVALVVTGIPLLAQMGLVAAATVVVSVLVALTATPAALALVGERVLRRRDRAAAPAAEAASGGRHIRLVTGHPVLATLAVVLVTGLLAVPAATLRLGLPDGSGEPLGSSAHTAFVLAEERFGAGVNGPVILVADLPRPASTGADVLHEQVEIARRVAVVDGVRSVVPFGVSADHRTLAFQVVPTTGPAAAETATTVRFLRATADTIEAETGATIGLTGQTVADLEVSQRLSAALPPYLAVVVGLSLLLLATVFRSLWVPTIATLGFLLSVAASFGATVAVYQWGWLGGVLGVATPGPILSFMPIMLIGVLFGLAMDYQMFLVAGMKEAHAHGEDAATAVRTGFGHGARVVTAAALIMASVFGGFVFADLTMIRPIGFGLAVGVLVDAFLVRMTLVPALMSLTGEAAWRFPRVLDRIAPHLDVEGTSLERPGAREAFAH